MAKSPKKKKKTTKKKAAGSKTAARKSAGGATAKGTARTRKKAAPARPTDAEIRERARQLWEAGGRKVGSAQSDWLEAEKQLLAERGITGA